MAEVFDVLRAEHGNMQLLLAALEHSPGHAAGASQEVLRARKAAAERLVIDAARHEAAEEGTSGPPFASGSVTATSWPTRPAPKSRRSGTAWPSWTSSSPPTTSLIRCSPT